METIDPNEQNSFRKKLFKLEEPVEANSWEKLNKRIDMEQRKKRRFLWWFFLVPVLVGLLWVFSQDIVIRNKETGNGRQENGNKGLEFKVKGLELADGKSKDVRNQESGNRRQETRNRRQETRKEISEAEKENSNAEREDTGARREITEAGKEVSKAGITTSETGKVSPINEMEKVIPDNSKLEADFKVKKPNSDKVNYENNSDQMAPDTKVEKELIDRKLKNQSLVKSQNRIRNRTKILPLNKVKKGGQTYENFAHIDKNETHSKKLRSNKNMGKKIAASKAKSKNAFVRNSVSAKVNNVDTTTGNEQNEAGLNFSKPIEPVQNKAQNQTQHVIKTPEEKSDAVLPDLKPWIPVKPVPQLDDSIKKKNIVANSIPDTLVVIDSIKKSETNSKNRIEIWTTSGAFGIFQKVTWNQNLSEYETTSLFRARSISNSIGVETAVFGKYKINSYLAFRLGVGLSYWKQNVSIVRIPGIYAPVFYEADAGNSSKLTGNWTQSNVEPEAWSQQWLMPWLHAQLEGKPFKELPFGARIGLQNTWLQGIGFTGAGQNSEGRLALAFTYSLFYQKSKWEIELKATQMVQKKFGLAGRKESEARNIWLGLGFGYRL